MPTLRIVNASPLILLTKVGRIDLLNAEGVDVVVPMPVLQEVSSLDRKRRSDCRAPESGWRVTRVGIGLAAQTSTAVMRRCR